MMPFEAVRILTLVSPLLDPPEKEGRPSDRSRARSGPASGAAVQVPRRATDTDGNPADMAMPLIFVGKEETDEHHAQSIIPTERRSPPIGRPTWPSPGMAPRPRCDRRAARRSRSPSSADADDTAFAVQTLTFGAEVPAQPKYDKLGPEEGPLLPGRAAGRASTSRRSSGSRGRAPPRASCTRTSYLRPRVRRAKKRGPGIPRGRPGEAEARRGVQLPGRPFRRPGHTRSGAERAVARDGSGVGRPRLAAAGTSIDPAPGSAPRRRQALRGPLARRHPRAASASTSSTSCRSSPARRSTRSSSSSPGSSACSGSSAQIRCRRRVPSSSLLTELLDADTGSIPALLDGRAVADVAPSSRLSTASLRTSPPRSPAATCRRAARRGRPGARRSCSRASARCRGRGATCSTASPPATCCRRRSTPASTGGRGSRSGLRARFKPKGEAIATSCSRSRRERRGVHGHLLARRLRARSRGARSSSSSACSFRRWPARRWTWTSVSGVQVRRAARLRRDAARADPVRRLLRSTRGPGHAERHHGRFHDRPAEPVGRRLQPREPEPGRRLRRALRGQAAQHLVRVLHPREPLAPDRQSVRRRLLPRPHGRRRGPAGVRGRDRVRCCVLGRLRSRLRQRLGHGGPLLQDRGPRLHARRLLPPARRGGGARHRDGRRSSCTSRCGTSRPAGSASARRRSASRSTWRCSAPRSRSAAPRSSPARATTRRWRSCSTSSPTRPRSTGTRTARRSRDRGVEHVLWTALPNGHDRRRAPAALRARRSALCETTTAATPSASSASSRRSSTGRSTATGCASRSCSTTAPARRGPGGRSRPGAVDLLFPPETASRPTPSRTTRSATCTRCRSAPLLQFLERVRRGGRKGTELPSLDDPLGAWRRSCRWPRSRTGSPTRLLLQRARAGGAARQGATARSSSRTSPTNLPPPPGRR